MRALLSSGRLKKIIILKDCAWFFAFFKSLIQLGTLYSIRKGAKGKLQANIIRSREIMDYFIASGLYSGFQSKT